MAQDALLAIDHVWGEVVSAQASAGSLPGLLERFSSEMSRWKLLMQEARDARFKPRVFAKAAAAAKLVIDGIAEALGEVRLHHSALTLTLSPHPHPSPINPQPSPWTSP